MTSVVLKYLELERTTDSLGYDLSTFSQKEAELKVGRNSALSQDHPTDQRQSVDFIQVSDNVFLRGKNLVDWGKVKKSFSSISPGPIPSSVQ